MTPVETVKYLIGRGDIKQKDVADRMGWTQAAISNRFRRNSLSAEEYLKILDILGYKCNIVEKETNDTAHTQRKGIGKHLRMMVNGVMYDTHKADAICHSDVDEDVFCELYLDYNGRYFVAEYKNWDGGVDSISPISEEDAMKMKSRLANKS